MQKTVKIVISTAGTLRFIYSDELLGLLHEGSNQSIRRVSQVEPNGTRWTADLTSVKGPILGPFITRQEALDKEVEWLTNNLASVRKD